LFYIITYLSNIRPDLKDRFSQIEDMKKAINFIEIRLVEKLTKLNRTYSQYMKDLFSEEAIYHVNIIAAR
jgi:hypothetical protein